MENFLGKLGLDYSPLGFGKGYNRAKRFSPQNRGLYFPGLNGGIFGGDNFFWGKAGLNL